MVFRMKQLHPHSILKGVDGSPFLFPDSCQLRTAASMKILRALLASEWPLFDKTASVLRNPGGFKHPEWKSKWNFICFVLICRTKIAIKCEGEDLPPSLVIISKHFPPENLKTKVPVCHPVSTPTIPEILI